jgi:hypothetical protein
MIVPLQFLSCSYIVYTTQAHGKKIYSIFPVKFRKIKLNSASYYIITISALYFILSAKHFISKPVAQVVE